MQDPQKWKIAMARFNGFYSNIPPFLKGEQIEDYHKIIKALEEASGEDLSHFEIPLERLKPKIISVRPGSYRGGPGTAQHSSDRYCDSTYFKGQIDGLKNYLSTVQPRSSSSGPNYRELNDYALEELMVTRKIKPPMTIENDQPVYRAPSREWIIAALIEKDNPPTRSHSITTNYTLHHSNLIQGSPGASISPTTGLQKEELKNLIDNLTELLQTASFDAETKEQIALNVDTISLHINSSRPNPSIIGASLQSLKAMIENAGGSILASALLPTIQLVLSKL